MAQRLVIILIKPAVRRAAPANPDVPAVLIPFPMGAAVLVQNVLPAVRQNLMKQAAPVEHTLVLTAAAGQENVAPPAHLPVEVEVPAVDLLEMENVAFIKQDGCL